MSVFHTEILYSFLFSPIHATSSVHPILLCGKALFCISKRNLCGEIHRALFINHLQERYAICKTARRNIIKNAILFTSH